MFTRFDSHLTLTLLLLLAALPLHAERYQVSTDAEGNARVEQVEGGQSTPDAQEKSSDATTPVINTDSVDKPISSRKRLQVKGVSDTEVTTPVLEIPITVPEPLPVEMPSKQKAVNVFEQRMLESEGKSRDELLNELSNKDADSGKVIVLDGVRYVDGNELLKDESLAEEGPRYFTAVDADGRSHNIYYSPEMEKRARNALREQPVQYTQATEYMQPEESKSVPATESLIHADPAALEILGSASPRNYFAKFLENCCRMLPNRDAHELDSSVSLFFDIKSGDSPYRFSEGESRYILVRLPDDTKDFSIRLTSYIKEFRKHGIDHGVFFPQITFLNKEKMPLRMIRDASFEFAGETWSSFGSLQGDFRVHREKEGAEEHFMLIHTDRSSLNKSSYFEMDGEQIQVQHMPIGSVSLAVLRH